MKKLLLPTAVLCTVGLTSLAAHRTGSTRTLRVAWTCPKNAVLAAMPTLGTVQWRSEYKDGKARFSLGLRPFDTVSMGVRLRIAGYKRDRFINDPALSSTRWFRYSTNRVQWLAAAWQDEAGFVAGVVRVDFSHAAARQPRSQDCWIFTPPQVTLHFYGHHPLFYGRPPSAPFRGGFGGMLRPWPIR